MPKIDFCIIGGGPAGVMAAIRANERGKKVVLIEKNNVLGNKFLLTGGGRCNLTHAGLTNKEFVSNYENNGDFLLSPLSKFSPNDLMKYFKDKGVKLKEEDGKVFPKSDKAREVLNCLIRELKGVKVLYDSEVVDIVFKDKKIEKVILKNGKEIEAENYLFTTGGKSYSHTGSTGDGFVWAKKMGHSVSDLKPALTPLETKEKWVQRMKGITLNNIGVSLNNKKKIIGDVLFTHFGISGPVILNLSGSINPRDNIFLDLEPDLNQEEVNKKLLNIFEENPKKDIINVLYFKDKFNTLLLELANIDKSTMCRNISREERMRLIKNIKKIKLTVIALMGFDKAMITKGGVSLKEIDSKTMKSKIIDNLYFAGEILDINGQTGGFNLQSAFSTGYVAGENVS
jgi:predicted Rossmann fold flavoprotein